MWIKSGKRWEVINPAPASTITPEERATSDRLKERFVAEAAAKYDLDVDEIKRLSRTYTSEELLRSIQEKMGGTAELVWKQDSIVMRKEPGGYRRCECSSIIQALHPMGNRSGPWNHDLSRKFVED
ncbi:MAG: hypothetical protein M9934_05000 [Thermomicrobiales bacterium]|nr:hypothetical protein [Thermomicrobiales bacterium]